MKRTTGNLLVVAALILAGIVLLGYLSSTDTELSRYNSGWNGTSGFYDQLEREGGIPTPLSTIRYSPAADAVILVEPRTLPGTPETEAMQQYLRDGGTIIILAKNASANAVLEAAGSSIRIQESILASVDMEYADPRMVIAYPAGEHTLLTGVESLALNQPARLTGGEALLQTSVISWIDINDNGRADGTEKFGRETVMAYEPLGGGEVIALSDTGILINSMDVTVSERDNAQFRESLISVMNTSYETDISDPFITVGILQAVTGMKSTTVIKMLAIVLITGIICATYGRRIL